MRQWWPAVVSVAIHQLVSGPIRTVGSNDKRNFDNILDLRNQLNHLWLCNEWRGIRICKKMCWETDLRLIFNGETMGKSSKFLEMKYCANLCHCLCCRYSFVPMQPNSQNHPIHRSNDIPKVLHCQHDTVHDSSNLPGILQSYNAFHSSQ